MYDDRVAGMSKRDQRWLAMVSAGRWQVHGIRCAQRAGLCVLALDGDAAAPGLAIADMSVVVDIRDPAAVVDAVARTGVTPSGVVSFVSEVGMMAAVAIRERYGLRGPDRELTVALTNKVRQREIWTVAGVPGPQWRVVRSVAEAQAVLESIGYPAIIKPADSAGSRGVTKLCVADQLESAFGKALQASPAQTVLVESYMDGTEYTVETFGDGRTTHVLAVTEKVKVPGTGGTVAMELSTPQSAQRVSVVAAAAVGALEALGYREGAGHTEVIFKDDGGLGLVEAAGRGGGFMVFDALAQRASGYDLVTACALQAVGIIPPPVQLASRAVTLRFFPSRAGTVTFLSGFEAASALEGVSAGPFVKVGDKVGSVKGDGDRLGYILSDAATQQAARALADRAEGLIRIGVQ